MPQADIMEFRSRKIVRNRQVTHEMSIVSSLPSTLGSSESQNMPWNLTYRIFPIFFIGYYGVTDGAQKTKNWIGVVGLG